MYYIPASFNWVTINSSILLYCVAFFNTVANRNLCFTNPFSHHGPLRGCKLDHSPPFWENVHPRVSHMIRFSLTHYENSHPFSHCVANWKDLKWKQWSWEPFQSKLTLRTISLHWMLACITNKVGALQTDKYECQCKFHSNFILAYTKFFLSLADTL